MSIFARLTPDLTAIELYPLTPRDMRLLTPLIAWPAEPTDESLSELADGRFVRVRETDRPTLGYGDTLAEGPPELQGDGHWHQTWIVTPPDLVALKAQANRQVNDVESGKISTRELARGLAQSPAAPRPRTADVMAKADQVRAAITAATTAAEIKTILDGLDAF